MSQTILATGVNIATGAASVPSALPTTSAGTLPTKVRVSATAAAHVRIGITGVTALATDLLVQPNDSIVLAVPRGLDHVAAIQDAAAGTVNVVPLEDS